MADNHRAMSKLPDFGERMLKDRIIMLGLPIDDTVSQDVIGKMLLLQKQSEDPIKLLVNTPGGLVSAGVAIIDTMSTIRTPVWTHCMGRAESMGAIIVAHGAKGHRTASPNSLLSISLPWNNAPTPETAKEIEKATTTLVEIVSRDTGRPVDEVRKDFEASRYFSAEDAQAYGLVDAILKKLPL
jgi:ATP-dependent Clp protease protease subunit